MKLKLIFPFILLNLAFSVIGFAQAVWQWSAPVNSIISSETNAHPNAFLWIPPNCKQVRGVVFGQHNMLEEGILEYDAFRNTLTELGFAEIWITPAIDPPFDFNKGAGEAFNEMMKNLASVSGYSELEFAPIVPIGHSALASYPWNFGAWNPARTLAMISVHGDAPLTNMTGSGRPNPEWGNRNIDGIPGLFVMGEYEWLEGRIQPAFKYKEEHPKAVIAYLADAGHGHFDYSDALVDYLCLFIKKAAKERLPELSPLNGPVALRAVDPQQGWMVDRWRKNAPLTASASAYQDYKGNKKEAGWAFDKEMAMATEGYYTKARGKKMQYLGYIQQNKLLPAAGFAGYNLKFIPEADGITFHISAAYLDTAGGKLAKAGHSKAKIEISRICGPVKKVNDTTFKVDFYRMGLNNPKRTNDIWLMAKSAGDSEYKSAVQQADMRIAFPNKEGKMQTITFPEIADYHLGSHDKGHIGLLAVSDAGVTVNYYIKEGPAYVTGNTVLLTKIPPRAKYPVKVTVVAWQYGNTTGEKLQTAAPVERVFYVYK